MSTVTSREVDRDVSAAKRAAATGPVVTMDRGEPSHVLPSVEEHHRLVADWRSIVDRLSVDDDSNLAPECLDLRLAAPDL